MSALRAAFKAWWTANVVGDDPEPAYSVLDRENGLPNRGGAA